MSPERTEILAPSNLLIFGVNRSLVRVEVE